MIRDDGVLAIAPYLVCQPPLIIDVIVRHSRSRLRLVASVPGAIGVLDMLAFRPNPFTHHDTSVAS
jgi:hypothetical protein